MADPASRFPGRGSRGTRERAAHEPLIGSNIVAEVPLAGRSFLDGAILPRNAEDEGRIKIEARRMTLADAAVV